VSNANKHIEARTANRIRTGEIELLILSIASLAIIRSFIINLAGVASFFAAYGGGPTTLLADTKKPIRAAGGG
jgi:hypothetical protein